MLMLNFSQPTVVCFSLGTINWVKLKVDGEQLDDLIFYNQVMEYLEDTLDTGQTEDRLYRFKSIQDHRGPYSPSDPEYLGSSYNMLIEWETGKMT